MISLNGDPNVLKSFWNEKVYKKLLEHFGDDMFRQPTEEEINTMKEISIKEQENMKQMSTEIDKEINEMGNKKNEKENGGVFGNFFKRTSGSIGGKLIKIII